jgi:hypothetical protein
MVILVMNCHGGSDLNVKCPAKSAVAVAGAGDGAAAGDSAGAAAGAAASCVARKHGEPVPVGEECHQGERGPTPPKITCMPPDIEKEQTRLRLVINNNKNNE